jgi:hypothetical protein
VDDHDNTAPRELRGLWAPGRIGKDVWAVVQAGGEGMRLRELTRHLYGDEREVQVTELSGPEVAVSTEAASRSSGR